MNRKIELLPVPLELKTPVWEQVFTVSPIVVVGTKNAGAGYDLAPKHMAIPLGWENYFGFVCTPGHTTYQNSLREGAFTVSYPRPEQLVLASMAASPRDEDNSKPALGHLPTFPAKRIDGVFLQDAYLFLECRLYRVVDGFGENSLIAGEIVAASACGEALRGIDRDDQDILHSLPLLAYLYPTRYTLLERSFAFPFPAGFSR